MADENNQVLEKPELIDIEKKDGILEELDLPPKLIKAIRDNAQTLQIAGICFLIAFFGWTYYDYYSANKKANASAELNLAVQEIEEEKQLEMFKKVTTDFSGTDAALWSEIEQAHKLFNDGEYGEALAKYKYVEAEISGQNPLNPILFKNVGLSYENTQDYENALSYYTKLEGFKGFRLDGLIARGRILELQEKPDEALKLYLEASLEKDLTGSAKSILTEKINNLQSSATEE